MSHYLWAMFMRCWQRWTLHTVGCKPGSPWGPRDPEEGKARATSWLLQGKAQASCWAF